MQGGSPIGIILNGSPLFTGDAGSGESEIGSVGYEIPFNRHFYAYTPPRPLDAIDAELAEVAGRIQENVGVMAQVRNNSAEQAMLGDFPKAVEEAVLGSGDAHHELMTQFLASKPLQNGFARLLLEMLSKTA